jgi:hypothetical protein
MTMTTRKTLLASYDANGARRAFGFATGAAFSFAVVAFIFIARFDGVFFDVVLFARFVFRVEILFVIFFACGCFF